MPGIKRTAQGLRFEFFSELLGRAVVNVARGPLHIRSCALRSQPAPQWYPPPPPEYTLQKVATVAGIGLGCHPRNCRCFLRPKASTLVTVITFGPSCFQRVSKVPTVTGVVAVVTFCPVCSCRASGVSRVTGIGVALILYKPSRES